MKCDSTQRRFTILRRSLASKWKLPKLLHAELHFSSRLKKTLAHCHSKNGSVTLSTRLLTPPWRDFLDEAITHELAHLATALRYRKRTKPHGPEWQAFMVKAGLEAKRAITVPRPRPLAAKTPSRNRYEHRCPVCQMVRVARRPVPRWRCADCIEIGLPGTLVIEKWAARA